MISASRGRWTPFWVSLSFAAAFIALRIFYRLLFGSVSWSAVGSAMTLALPFATVIVACGLISSLVDVRRFLVSASQLRWGRSLGTALAIALSSFPTLITVVRRMNSARELRGMRSRMAFLVPLFEHTVERAIALAAAMDTKGFGSRRGTTVCDIPAITLSDYSLSWNGREVLRNISLTLTPGSITVLTGATGSGKTALLESIAGLATHFHGGTSTGSLMVGTCDRVTTVPRDTASLIGYVPQNVRLSFAGATVREELSFGLRVQSWDKQEIASRVDELLTLFSLTDLADRPLEFLSAGQATRLAIAAALAPRPPILLLDEPLADLDAASVSTVVTLLGDLHAREELTLVITEHHTAPLAELNPQWLHIAEGKVAPGQWDTGRMSVYQPRNIAVVGREEVLRVTTLSVAINSCELVQDVSFTARTAELIAVTGPNGAGKSTLLAALASGKYLGNAQVRGDELSALPALARITRVAFVPEQVSDFFVTESLAEELARADKVAGIPAGKALTELTFFSILDQKLQDSQLAKVLATHPRDLSAGTQVALAIALQLSWKPSVMLIDEPSRGLDPAARSSMAEVLRCVAETGTTVIFATHDRVFAQELDARVLELSDGRLVHSVEVSS
ncbi:energy-coupling factor transporter ATP-binding protein EcfA2 [Aurantimicrobium minutum]|uniref:ATP-binding cassette domain-containing protein n=1 Tax=Aurantimicrobium minutum TaxID=708131 RepID=UPI0024730D5E|nr:ATP-binding cassette domain-containing protein [Aurantimicrobium minutum]MDH6532233.1 energy-coupling factor transporter ATP-binding protein EcfA2 [Aurantimicrobium minutum]